ncbi:MAG: hypothetical protein MJ195_02750 [Mycoplasmoidaceae bacterium]|nr:hypothetical protein [Mycoplasmoidaceae bacterium]
MFSQGLPLEAIEGTDEGLTQIDVEISFAGGMLGELIPFVIDFDTTLTTQFYDYNPIGIDPEPKPNLGSSDSTIDFIYYPRGF